MSCRRSLSWAVLIGLATIGCQQSDSPLPLVGTLERDRLELVAEAQERIVEVAVSEGERVEAGDLLMRLDPNVYEAEIEAVLAALRRAEERVAELVRGPRNERIVEARARFAAAVDQLETEQREYQRIYNLVDEGIAAQSDLDRAFSSRRAAQSERDRAEAALAELVNGTTAEELAQARSTVAESAANLSRLEQIAARLEIRAPRQGIIDAIPYKLGERPPKGATVLVMLADTAPYARVYVPEPIRARISAGLEATIVVDGIEEPFSGTVRYVASEASFTPYSSLTQRDRSRFSYVSEITLNGERARELPTGLPLEVDFPGL